MKTIGTVLLLIHLSPAMVFAYYNNNCHDSLCMLRYENLKKQQKAGTVLFAIGTVMFSGGLICAALTPTSFSGSSFNEVQDKMNAADSQRRTGLTISISGLAVGLFGLLVQMPANIELKKYEADPYSQLINKPGYGTKGPNAAEPDSGRFYASE